MLRNYVVVAHRFYHLDVELLLSVCKSWLEHDKIVIIQTRFEVNSVSEGRHFASCQVDPSLDFPSPVAELEHVGVVFPVVGLESGDDGDGVEILSVEVGVVFQVCVDLVDGEGDDGFVVDRFVFFLRRVHLRFSWLPPLGYYYN